MSSAVVLRQCPHCDKSFINSSFLQNHLQRRHPDEFEMQQSRSDSEKKSQLNVLKDKKLESRMQDIKNQHESEKNQLLSKLSRMHRSREKMERRLQGREHKEPVLPPSGHQDSRAPAPEPKPKRVVRDSSSVSERRRPPVSQPVDSRRAEAMPAPERRERPTPAALRRNPDLRKELRRRWSTPWNRSWRTWGSGRGRAA
ncbi:hypothetical protein NHX12_016241 [Muraenolepis orangiensis]|uniref:C2H2-type domain-containing protein n=1 Tax=Muraenolepis orangiensis TaxID=630683 RepID=A0A9Q0D859_9TELE|nr:hypothetical protein NHX12_016241 [Muraenolepis orangiensis]